MNQGVGDELLDRFVADRFDSTDWWLVCEDELSLRPDPWLVKAEGSWFSCEGRIYWYELDSHLVSGFADKWSSGYPTNAFVLIGTPPDELARAEEVSVELLRVLASQVRAVIVAAYDAEVLVYTEL